MGEIWFFLRTRKRFWLGPIVVVAVLVVLLLWLAQRSDFARLVYTTF
jgi:hypothetical protein